MKFKERVRVVFEEWKNQDFCQEAKVLNEKVGKDYFDISNPHFFTGNLNAELVLIHLNPKRNKDQWNKKCSFENFENYWDFYSKFGKIHYGIDSNRTHKSQFDFKQIRFLRPFNLLPIKNEDKFENLENVIDKKLQLELVPYGSPDFIFQKIGSKNLKPFIENIISLINEAPRKYIIFCGRVFEHVLSDIIKEKFSYSFKLTKRDGTETKSNFEIINLKLEIGNKTIDACIAPQYAKQGYPEDEYGKMIAKLYGKYD